MDFFKNIRSNIIDEQFKITVYKDKVDILNYESIGHFDDNKVIVRHKDGTVEIKGKKLVVSRLMNDEILIKGIIENINLRWYFE